MQPVEIPSQRSLVSGKPSSRFRVLPFAGTLLLSLGAIFFLLLSVGLWYLRGLLLHSEQRLLSRLATEAVCTEVGAKKQVSLTFGTDEALPPDSFLPEVGYRFTPPDSRVPVEGADLIPGRDFPTFEKARAAALDFAKPGDTLTIYYNPANPLESSLIGGQRETNTGPVLSIAMSVTTVSGLACLLGVFAWRRWWSRRELADGGAIALWTFVLYGGIGATLTFTGLVFFLSGTYGLWTGHALSGWVATEGTIMSARVEASSGSEYVSYSPKIRYGFEADGHRESEKIYAGPMTKSYDDEEEAEDFLESFPVGAEVGVYYNPDNPNQSALIPETAGGEWIAVVLGFIALAIGLVAGASAFSVLVVGVRVVPQANS